MKEMNITTYDTPFHDRPRTAAAAESPVLDLGGGIVGLGIASMSERVEQLCGRLEVTLSNHGTTGTTVRVWLPLAKDAG
jgi:glucose-6-phosphate-specific signal transduction histidine kinase